MENTIPSECGKWKSTPQNNTSLLNITVLKNALIIGYFSENCKDFFRSFFVTYCAYTDVS